jgi:hypothetical protein
VGGHGGVVRAPSLNESNDVARSLSNAKSSGHQCEPNPDVGTKEKEIPVAVPNNNNNNNNIILTLYEFGSRQTVLTIATK